MIPLQLFFNYANEINASKNFLSQKSAQKKIRSGRGKAGLGTDPGQWPLINLLGAQNRSAGRIVKKYLHPAARRRNRHCVFFMCCCYLHKHYTCSEFWSTNTLLSGKSLREVLYHYSNRTRASPTRFRFLRPAPDKRSFRTRCILDTP